MPSQPTTAGSAGFFPALRELVRCYLAFESYAAAHSRRYDLTLPQFDVIATLGNTPGMSCRELGERTLITKGTLTGVLDRLADKGLVRRAASANDRRSYRVQLTDPGQVLFEKIFPEHVDHLAAAFGEVDPAALAELTEGMARLRRAFQESAAGGV